MPFGCPASISTDLTPPPRSLKSSPAVKLEPCSLPLAMKYRGFTVAVIPGPAAVQRLFELTNTTEHLPFVDP